MHALSLNHCLCQQNTHTHTHTRVHVCVCVCECIQNEFQFQGFKLGRFFKGKLWGGGVHKKQETRQLVLNHTEDKFLCRRQRKTHPYPEDGGRIEDRKCHCVRLNDPAYIHSSIP